MNTAKFMRERLVQYSRYKFKNFDKNTPESRTRFALDITTTIEEKNWSSSSFASFYLLNWPKMTI